MAATPEPIRAISTPARAGPIIRARLNDAEFSPTALARSLLSTISLTNAWRAGTSSALAVPNRNVRTYTCHTVIELVIASRPITRAVAPMIDCVQLRTVRLA